MSLDESLLRDVAYLALQALEGEISEADFVRLQEILRTNAEARSIYCKILDINLGMQEPANLLALHSFPADLSHDPILCEAIAETQQPSSPVDRDRIEAIEQKAQRKLEAFLAEQERIRREQRVSPAPPRFDMGRIVREVMERLQAILTFTGRTAAYLSVSAAVLLIVIAGIQYHLSQRQYQLSQRQLAVLDKTVDAVWLEAPDPENLRAGQYQLLEGYAELLFVSGARVIVEAPSHLQLLSPKHVQLEGGTVTGLVPPQARGFTVSTRSARITDLGTEFGVRIQPNGSTYTAVFQGSVELKGADRSQREARPVEANEQVLTSADGVLSHTRTLELNHGFHRSWDDVLYLPKVSGQMRALRQAPPDLRAGVLESSQHIFVVPERRNVVLSEELDVQVGRAGVYRATGTPAVIKAGQRVDSYILHCDPVGSSWALVRLAGQIQFPRPILGILTKNSALARSDASLGSPGTQYLGDMAYRGADLNNDPDQSDGFAILPDGKSLDVVLAGRELTDQMRVLIAAAPERSPTPKGIIESEQ